MLDGFGRPSKISHKSNNTYTVVTLGMTLDRGFSDLGFSGLELE